MGPQPAGRPGAQGPSRSRPGPQGPGGYREAADKFVRRVDLEGRSPPRKSSLVFCPCTAGPAWLGPGRVLERAYCCSEPFSTCRNGERALHVARSLCPTGSCCWEDTCRRRTDPPKVGSCDYGDQCCPSTVFMCRDGMASYAHPDCPTRCCARGCGMLWFIV